MCKVRLDYRLQLRDYVLGAHGRSRGFLAQSDGYERLVRRTDEWALPATPFPGLGCAGCVRSVPAVVCSTVPPSPTSLRRVSITYSLALTRFRGTWGTPDRGGLSCVWCDGRERLHHGGTAYPKFSCYRKGTRKRHPLVMPQDPAKYRPHRPYPHQCSDLQDPCAVGSTVICRPLMDRYRPHRKYRPRIERVEMSRFAGLSPPR